MPPLKNTLSSIASIAVMGLGLATLIPSGPALAIERIGWSKTKETMYIHGEIKFGDADIIADAMRTNRRKLRGVILNSPGGNPFEGAKLADMVRNYDFDTGVAQGGVCASACFMLWAAGKNKYVYADSLIGIHSASNLNAQTGIRGEDPASFMVTMAMARVYFALKVPFYLIGIMVVTPPSPAPIYELTDADKAAMGARLMQ